MANIKPVNPPAGEAEDASEGRMSFFEHLAELRKRIINSLIAIALCAGVGVTISEKVIKIINAPMTTALARNGLNPALYTRAPTEIVGLWINTGLYIGIALAMPYVLYQVWLFIAPGLYKHERSAVTSFIFFGTLLFICGAALAYFFMLPRMLDFLVYFTKGFSIQPLIDVDEYYSLILIVTVGVGVVFEMPVVVYVLSLFGLVTPRFLIKNFQYALLLITVAAAIITPTPDATTMILFMMPMVALYFVSVLVSYLVFRKKKAAKAAAEATV